MQATHDEEQEKEAAAIDAAAAAERADQQARIPLVAAGLHLPDRDGVFILDNFQSIPELVHLDQSTGNVNRDTNHNVLRAAIGSFSGAKEPVRINGQAAPRSRPRGRSRPLRLPQYRQFRRGRAGRRHGGQHPRRQFPKQG